MVSTTHIDLRDLAGSDFGAPMHLLIVPAGLHQTEAEALVRFAGVPEEINRAIDLQTGAEIIHKTK